MTDQPPTRYPLLHNMHTVSLLLPRVGCDWSSYQTLCKRRLSLGAEFYSHVKLRLTKYGVLFSARGSLELAKLTLALVQWMLEGDIYPMSPLPDTTNTSRISTARSREHSEKPYGLFFARYRDLIGPIHLSTQVPNFWSSYRLVQILVLLMKSQIHDIVAALYIQNQLFAELLVHASCQSGVVDKRSRGCGSINAKSFHKRTSGGTSDPDLEISCGCPATKSH